MKKFLLAFFLVFLWSVTALADVNPHYVAGMTAHDSGKTLEAVKEWMAGAEQGDGDCNNALGWLYMSGSGVEKNEAEAIRYFKRGVELENEKAHANLALAYIRGSGGLPKDYDAAYALMKKVEDSEVPFVLRVSGLVYKHGIGTSKDYEKALDFFKKIKDDNEQTKKDIAFLEKEIALQKSGVREARDLTAEVKKNQLRFDKQFKNKEISVRGLVDKVEQARNSQDGFVLHLLPAGNAIFEFIECRFGLDHEDALLSLDKGNEVIVTGTYKGKQDFQVGAFALFNCKIVE